MTGSYMPMELSLLCKDVEYNSSGVEDLTLVNHESVLSPNQKEPRDAILRSSGSIPAKGQALRYHSSDTLGKLRLKTPASEFSSARKPSRLKTAPFPSVAA